MFFGSIINYLCATMFSRMNTDKPLTTLSMAPFQGITDSCFRNVFERHFGGIDKYYTPFFSGIHTSNSRNLRNNEISPEHNDTKKVVPQILSNDSSEIVRFAMQCKEFGYKEINLNLGCPFPRVANKKRGSGLLPHPDMIGNMLAGYFAQTDMGLSIKCRLGSADKTEIKELIDVFNRFPITELIIHPRIGKQLYKGEADYMYFSELIPSVHCKLTYNGDIFTAAKFAELKDLFKTVNSFMLGRGLLSNPFLAEEIAGTGNSEPKKERLHDFMNDLYSERVRQTNGNLTVLGRMKELWSYTMLMFDNPQDVWRRIRKQNSFEGYEEAVSEIFENQKIAS